MHLAGFFQDSDSQRHLDWAHHRFGSAVSGQLDIQASSLAASIGLLIAEHVPVIIAVELLTE